MFTLGLIMLPITKISDLKIGMVFQTPANGSFIPNSIIQIIQVKDSVNYVSYEYLASSDRCTTWGSKFWNDTVAAAFAQCVPIDNYPQANLVCQDCQQFCSQNCIIKS